MTSVPPSNDVENRLTRLERLMINHGELLAHTASLANRNATDFDRMLAAFDSVRDALRSVVTVTERNAVDIETLTQEMRIMSQRVDSLAAASERHDRILDYLLRREAGDIETE
jgi:hypothetical protein